MYDKKIVSLKDLFANPANFFALGCGSGLVRPAPGTWGSLFALLPYLALAHLHWALYAAVLLFSFAIGVYFCDACAKFLGVHDHGAIVWDEFVGVWLTLFLVPVEPIYILLGFALFRFFDILKPWPIKWLDKSVDGGFGIMIDDVLAAVYAWLVLQAGIYFLS